MIVALVITIPTLCSLGSEPCWGKKVRRRGLMLQKVVTIGGKRPGPPQQELALEDGNGVVTELGLGWWGLVRRGGNGRGEGGGGCDGGQGSEHQAAECMIISLR